MNPVNLTFPLLPARNLPPKGTAGTKRGIFGSLRVRLPLELVKKEMVLRFLDKLFSINAVFHPGTSPRSLAHLKRNGGCKCRAGLALNGSLPSDRPVRTKLSNIKIDAYQNQCGLERVDSLV